MAEESINILHIDTEKYWRGGQQQVFYLHQGLIQRGINSFLVCNKNSELGIKSKEHNLPYIEQNMFGELDLIAAYKISRLCKKRKINIIQAHSAHALSIGILVKSFYPSSILIGVRRVDFSIDRNYFSRKKYNSSKIDRIVCISDFIKSVLIKDGIPDQKLITIRSGVNINKFKDTESSSSFRKNLGVLDNELLLGTVAAFAGHKDIPNLLNAFSQVIKSFRSIKLCIVGDGPLKAEMIKLINQLELSDYIILPGYSEEVGKYLKSFDIFVLSSKKEGLGTSIIDAFSVGLPVIATRTGGIPELIEHNNNGLLVEPKNPSELASAILELANDKGKRERLSKTALSKVHQFSVEETIDQNISEYNNLLKILTHE